MAATKRIQAITDAIKFIRDDKSSKAISILEKLIHTGPKRAPTGYNLFVGTMLKEKKKMQECTAAWKELTKDEHDEWNAKAKASHPVSDRETESETEEVIEKPKQGKQSKKEQNKKEQKTKNVKKGKKSAKETESESESSDETVQSEDDE